MSLSILGIDISKATYHVTLLHGEKRYRGEFANRLSEFKQLSSWLKKHQVTHLHACMEATGRYGDELAHYLHDAGHQVSVVNPMQIKSFARSQLLRNKTDKLDADTIATFCATIQPPAWTPTPPEMRELKEFLRQYDDLQATIVQTKNRLQSGVRTPLVLQQLQAQLDFLTTQLETLKQTIRDHIDHSPDLKRQQELLESIPGIGEITASRIVACHVLRFVNARALACYAGLTPKQHLSGTSVHRKSRLSKMGDAELRHALYFPAMTAIRHNPRVRDLAERMREQGKEEMTILGAGMHKLLCLAFGVLKSGKPFDPDYAFSA